MLVILALACPSCLVERDYMYAAFFRGGLVALCVFLMGVVVSFLLRRHGAAIFLLAGSGLAFFTVSHLAFFFGGRDLLALAMIESHRYEMVFLLVLCICVIPAFSLYELILRLRGRH
jgi:hypothetical protein